MCPGGIVLTIAVPGVDVYRLTHLLLDLNGTIVLDGELIPGVAERVAKLRDQVQVELLSADTLGRLAATAQALGIDSYRLQPGAEAEQKAARVAALGATSIVALGNGANDAAMLRAAALGIAVLGPEGLASAALTAADVVVPSVTAGLDLLLHPLRLIATLRH
jgi:P-type E1-E2 ATPase